MADANDIARVGCYTYLEKKGRGVAVSVRGGPGGVPTWNGMKLEPF